MASFVSAASAVRCAIQIQRELDKHAQTNSEHPLKVRVGAAAGEPVEQNNDLFGSTVQLAARLCAHAHPEQILVSNAIAEPCIGKGLSLADVGDGPHSGFGSPDPRPSLPRWRRALYSARRPFIRRPWRSNSERLHFPVRAHAAGWRRANWCRSLRLI